MHKRSIFFPNLDGLRFFSFLLVFLAHSFVTNDPAITQSGWYHFVKGNSSSYAEMGVSFFFVLSGFLITYLLLQEKEAQGKINVPYFYFRRVLRIWPLYYLIVLFGFFGFPILKSLFGQTTHETADPWLCFTFLNNFNNIKNGPPDASSLAVLWSVAIEEQFYLVWPLLLFKTPKKYYLPVMVGVVSISTLFRFTFYKTTSIDDHTLGVITDMAMGGIGAYLSMYNRRFLERIEAIPKPFLLCVYGLCLACMCFKELLYGNTFVWIIHRVILSAAFITIILEQNFSKNSLFKTGNFKAISWLGKYTYGLYCYHAIAILVSTTLLAKLSLNHQPWQIWLLELPVSMGLSIAFSYFSYTWFESWFLKLKDRFAIIESGHKPTNEPVVVKE